MPVDICALGRRWQVQIRTSGVVVGHSAPFQSSYYPMMIWTTCLVSMLAITASLPLSEAGQAVGLDAESEWVQNIFYPNVDTSWTPGEQEGVIWYVNPFL